MQEAVVNSCQSLVPVKLATMLPVATTCRHGAGYWVPQRSINLCCRRLRFVQKFFFLSNSEKFDTVTIEKLKLQLQLSKLQARE